MSGWKKSAIELREIASAVNPTDTNNITIRATTNNNIKVFDGTTEETVAYVSDLASISGSLEDSISDLEIDVATLYVNVNDISGWALDATHLEPYITEAEVATISGSLATDIAANSSSISDLETDVGAISGDVATIESGIEEAYFLCGLEKDALPTVTFTDATLTVDIVGDHNVWLRGTRVAKTTDSIVIPDVTDSYFIYYDSDFNLTYSTTPWDILTTAPVAIVVWNSFLGEGKLLEERHTTQFNAAEHKYNHTTFGSRYESGFLLGDYTLQTDTIAAVSWSVASGKFWDEDIENELAALAAGGPYSIFYRTGAAGEWRWSDTETLPFFNDGTDIEFNEYTGATWQRTPITAIEAFVNYYVVATNIANAEPIIVIPGQATYDSLSAAQGESIGDLDLGDLAGIFPENIPLYKTTFRRRLNYSDITYNARLEAVETIIGTVIQDVASSSVSHNETTGKQGGTAGEYYHLTENQFDDYIGATEVASISGSLATDIAANSSSISDLETDVATISGNLETLSDDAVRKYSISSPLMSNQSVYSGIELNTGLGQFKVDYDTGNTNVPVDINFDKSPGYGAIRYPLMVELDSQADDTIISSQYSNTSNKIWNKNGELYWNDEEVATSSDLTSIQTNVSTISGDVATNTFDISDLEIDIATLDAAVTDISGWALDSSDLDAYITESQVATISGSLNSDIEANSSSITSLQTDVADISGWALSEAVESLEGLTGAIDISGGSDIEVTTSGQTINIAYTGTGGGEFDMLSDLTSSSVAITGTTTLTSTAFGKMHVISGTTSDYTVTLPAASGNGGKIIGIRIDGAATQLFTIDANSSETIDGLTERIMWRSEVAILLCDGSGWTKIGGKSVSMGAILSRASDISIANSSTTTIDWTFSTGISKGPAAMSSTTTDRLYALRAGNYHLIYTYRWRDSFAADRILPFISTDSIAAVVRSESHPNNAAFDSGHVSYIFNYDSNPASFTSNWFECGIRQDSGSSQVLQTSNGYGNFRIVETPIW